jgi:pyruvate/2-oxoglutarate dehydrogenase complex dihydrolipoamide dehydrogenase (E3) component
MKNFDAIIIGTGQAGPSLAARFSEAGKSVAIIERHKFGGTCVNTGCIPTKTMVASAYAAHVARRAGEYGFNINSDVRVDMKRVKARKDAISGRSNKGVEEWLRGLKNCTVVQGHARFQSPDTVVVNDEPLEADKIYINVGGRASVPEMPGIHEVPFLTNSSMMDVDFLPNHLIVIGGSYVGLEFGQIFRRFGSTVTIVEMGPRLIGREDEDVSEAVREVLEAEGIQIRLNTKCISLKKHDCRIGIRVDCEEGAPEIFGTHILLAVGRVPNTSDLGLDGQVSRPTIEATSSLTINYKRTCPASGRWATATAAALLRILPTTTMRSSRTISSTQTIAASQIGSRPTRCT